MLIYREEYRICEDDRRHRLCLRCPQTGHCVSRVVSAKLLFTTSLENLCDSGHSTNTTDQPSEDHLRRLRTIRRVKRGDGKNRVEYPEEKNP